MRNSLTAPKADALPGCATPRLAEYLGKAPIERNPEGVIRGNERQNEAGTGSESPEISQYLCGAAFGAAYAAGNVA